MQPDSPPTPNPALVDFWLAPARNRVLIGGRSSSKSWDAASFAIFLASQYKLRILCVRQIQNRIEESVYSLLKIQIDRYQAGAEFDIQNKKIYHKHTSSEFMFYGLWRNIDEIKSIESVDILWIEEGHNLTEEQWDILEPTIRKEGSQVWMIFNPKLATDFAYRRFVRNPPPDTIIRHINYDENPFISKTMMDIINAAKIEDPDKFANIYLGVPLEDDDNAIIKRSWVLAAVDAHKALGFEPIGRKRLGFDVADSGPDKCSWVYAHGNVVLNADVWQASENELLKSCTRVFRKAKEYNALITYDSIGVGATVGAKIIELNIPFQPSEKISHNKFNAGGAIYRPESNYSHGVKNKDMFGNIKAQAWWRLADKFRATYNAVKDKKNYNVEDLISISSDLPHLQLLIDELTTPKVDYDQYGRVKVESKKDLAKRDVPSHNIADALVMAFAPGQEPIKIDESILR